LKTAAVCWSLHRRHTWYQKADKAFSHLDVNHLEWPAAVSRFSRTWKEMFF